MCAPIYVNMSVYGCIYIYIYIYIHTYIYIYIFAGVPRSLRRGGDPPWLVGSSRPAAGEF